MVRYIETAEWKAFVLILCLSFLGAFILSFLPIKAFSQKRKMAAFFAALQGIILSLFIFETVDNYEQNRKELNDQLSYYRAKATRDIKKGFIEIEYAGGLEFPTAQELNMRVEEDSLRKLYGFSYRNSGCTVGAAIQTAQEEYERMTKPFLNQRNGPQWERRLEEQIKHVRKKYQ